MTRWVVYLGTIEQGVGTIGIGDSEGVLREGAQDPTRIIEEFYGFVASIDDHCCDLGILDSIDLDIMDSGIEAVDSKCSGKGESLGLVVGWSLQSITGGSKTHADHFSNTN